MVAAIFALSLGAWLTGAAQQPAAAPLPVPQLPPQTFVEWLAALRSEAVTRGITEATLDRALTDLEPLPVVIERDRSQAELVLTLDQYLERRLTRAMIKAAQKMGAQHRTLLRKVSAKYGVPPGVIVAVWGLESNYGRFSGVRPTIATLATLAYDPRRSAMFREELFNALKILDSGDVEPVALKGSWAGALGQPQFMPSSFLEFAQDFDGDGRRDIWKSTPDVFASIANYLSAHGWTKGRTWGREVKVPAAIADAVADAAPLQEAGCLAERQMSVPLPLNEWRKLGVRTMTGTKVPLTNLKASLVAAGPRRFLVYPNYQALLAYNCVHAYGLSVALLSGRVH
ncbi:MAG: lytic murein transglycosylase [Acidobacteria bacterium]|nr:MAG: lytic murein transglycosylase [Acidobacteriota bacterium]